MGTLAALMIATPVFGLSLTPPPASLSPASLGVSPAALGGLAAPAALHAALPALQATGGGDDEAGAGEGAGATAAEGGLSMAEYGALMRRRADIARIHRPLGIATWASMLVTLTLGFFQWHNLYGPFQPLEGTPCVTGNGIIFGESQCSGTPWVHLGSALLTTALYTATFSLSLLMPDPDNADEGDSAYAQNLRTHKILRWVHFGGMIAQIALGIIIANAEKFGVDRANDYDTLSALSTVHMGLGLVTFGALTWAGILFL